MSPFRSIFWKEYRQQRGLVLTFVLCCAFCCFGAYALLQFSRRFYDIVPFIEIPPFWTIVTIFTATYVACAAATVFSREHDEGTYDYLRRLPLSGRTVLLGKGAWLLLSSAVVGLLLALIAWISHALFKIHIPTLSLSFGELLRQPTVLGIGLMPLEALCWGLLYSALFRRQITAVLATILLVPFVQIFVLYVVICLFSLYADGVMIAGGSIEQMYEIYVALTWCVFRLLTALIAGGSGVLLASGWMRREEPEQAIEAVYSMSRTKMPTPRYDTSGKPVDTAFSDFRLTPAGPFVSLLWQAVRQSQTMLLLGLLIVVGWAVWLTVSLNLPLERYHYSSTRESLTAFFTVLSFVGICLFSGSVFWQDHRDGAVRMLIHRGIEPGKLWWSRILPFAGVYLLPLGCLLPVFLVKGVRWDEFAQVMCYYLVFLCTGSFVSIVCRSVITAIFVNILAALSVMSLSGYLHRQFGRDLADYFHIISYPKISPLITMPILMIACLVASRVYAEDWLRERSILRSLIRPALVLLAALLLIAGIASL